MFCIRCGKKLQSEFAFCPYCGTNIVNPQEHKSEDNKGFDIRDGVLVKYHGCASHVIIPSNVTRIGSLAFVENEKNEIKNFDGTYCEEYAGNKYITHITVPESVTQIDASAFTSCPNLTEVVLPNNLRKIERAVFARCKKLSFVHIPKSVTYIGHNAFLGCDLSRTTIPESVVDMEVTFVKENILYDSTLYTPCYGGIVLTPIDKRSKYRDTQCKLNSKYRTIQRWLRQGLCRHCGAPRSTLFNRNNICKQCGEKWDVGWR